MDTALKMNDCNLDDANNVDNGSNVQDSKEINSIEIEPELCKSEIKNHLNNETDTNVSDKTLENKDEQKNTQKDDELKENNDVYRKLLTIIDSDSEDDNIFISKSISKKTIHESSDDEISNLDQNNKFKKHSINKNKKNDFDSDSDDTSNIINGNDNEETITSERKDTNNIQSRIQTLVDLDSETEDDEKQLSPMKNKKRTKKQGEKKSNSKMRKVSLRASKEEAMKQIHSETQRLVRETEVSLPYHRPKQRSLQEFLSRRKVITSLPKAPTMAAKLKMSSAIVDEVLKEKEKEAEIFYKSSDSEEEIIEDHSSDKENLESKQELKNNNVSRKLFTDISSSVNDNKEGNISNETQETLAEMKECEDNEVITNGETKNPNDSLIVEVHCDSDDAENINETSELKVVKSCGISENAKVSDTSLPKDVTDISENENNDHEENNIKAPESPDSSVAKVNNDYAKPVKRSLGLDENELDEYGLPSPKFDDLLNINEKKTSLNFTSLKPKLSGAPGSMIDLTDEIKPNKNGVNALIDRFMNKHSKASRRTDDTLNVTVTHIIKSPDGISVVKETLPYKSAATMNEDFKLKKPGAKLVRLKEELKHKMALKRDEEWKQREQEMKEQEIEWDDSIIEEEHLSDTSVESEKSDEDELEEDDVYIMKEKKKKRNAYVDDEADVSDDYINDSEEDESSEHSENEEDNEKDVKCITFKRILEPSDDDSLYSNTDNVESTTDKEKTSSLSQVIGVDMFDINAKANEENSDNESDIQAFQVHAANDLKCQTPQIKMNCFDFISPVTQLTALNARVESENESPEIEKQLPINKINSILIGYTQSQELSQELNDLKKRSLPQRELFPDQSKLLGKQSTQDNFRLSSEPNVTESQLLDLCSGTFGSQVSDPKQSTNEFFDETSQSVQASPEKDSLIAKENTYNEGEEITSRNKLRVVSSDEEDSAQDKINNRSKRKVKKLDLSDDESEKDSAESSDDEEKEDDDQDKYVDYDSEENEIVVSKKNIKQYATTFLEEEAELSESDCEVSADENEDELDKLELEEVDDEDIDESQVKKQLEKLHVKQLLDEDQKEVRMLKELLFEDGDLYSESARERKFKWKNIDKQEDNDNSPLLEGQDGWVDLSDDEEEFKWRQLKFERDKFLAEQMGKFDDDIEKDLGTSQIFNYGMKILKKRRITESLKEDTLLEVDSKTESRIPHTVAEMLNSTKLEGSSSVIHSVLRKRSFLAKGEESLARLAAVAKKKDKSLAAIDRKKFVFIPIDRSTKKENSPVIKIQPKPFNVRKKR